MPLVLHWQNKNCTYRSPKLRPPSARHSVCRMITAETKYPVPKSGISGTENEILSLKIHPDHSPRFHRLEVVSDHDRPVSAVRSPSPSGFSNPASPIPGKGIHQCQTHVFYSQSSKSIFRSGVEAEREDSSSYVEHSILREQPLPRCERPYLEHSLTL